MGIMKVIIALLLGVQARHHHRHHRSHDLVELRSTAGQGTWLKKRLLQLDEGQWDPSVLDVMNEGVYTKDYADALDEQIVSEPAPIKIADHFGVVGGTGAEFTAKETLDEPVKLEKEPKIEQK